MNHDKKLLFMEKYKNVMEICLEDEKKHMEKCDKI
jgi:hypothetical protein